MMNPAAPGRPRPRPNGAPAPGRLRTRPIPPPAAASPDLRQAIVDPITAASKKLTDAAGGLADVAAYDPIITIPGFAGGAAREMPWSKAESALAEEYARLSMDQKSPEEIAAEYDAKTAEEMKQAISGVARPHNTLADFQDPAPVDPITREPMPAPASRRSDPTLLMAAALMGLVAPEAAAPAVQGVISGTAERAAQADADALRRWSANMDAQEKQYADRLRTRAEAISAGLRKAGVQTDEANAQYNAGVEAAKLGVAARVLPLKAAALHTATRTGNQVAGIQRFTEAARARVAADRTQKTNQWKAAFDVAGAEMDAAERTSRANQSLVSAQHSAATLALAQTEAARRAEQARIENRLSERRIHVEEESNRLRQWAQANAGVLTPEQYVSAMRSFTTILSETGDDLRTLEAQYAPFRSPDGNWMDRDRRTGRSPMETQYNALRDTAVANRNAAREVVAEVGRLVAKSMGVPTELNHGRLTVLGRQGAGAKP